MPHDDRHFYFSPRTPLISAFLDRKIFAASAGDALMVFIAALAHYNTSSRRMAADISSVRRFEAGRRRHHGIRKWVALMRVDKPYSDRHILALAISSRARRRHAHILRARCAARH